MCVYIYISFGAFWAWHQCKETTNHKSHFPEGITRQPILFIPSSHHKRVGVLHPKTSWLLGREKLLPEKKLFWGKFCPKFRDSIFRPF